MNRFLPGDPFNPSEIDRLSDADKRRIAQQLGLFLATLHQSYDQSIHFDTGHVRYRKNDPETEGQPEYVEF